MRNLAPGRLSLLATTALLCGVVVAATPAPEPVMHTVIIENMAYGPASLAVHRGDRIVWANKDLFPHTVSATKGPFDSGSIAAGASWTYTATRPGTYAYSCKFHPTMHGELKVE